MGTFETHVVRTMKTCKLHSCIINSSPLYSWQERSQGINGQLRAHAALLAVRSCLRGCTWEEACPALCMASASEMQLLHLLNVFCLKLA